MRPCTLCGADLADAITVAATGRHGDACHEVACAACGLVQRADMPGDTELSAYYTGPYRAKFTRSPVVADDGSVHEWGTPEAERITDERTAAYADFIVSSLGLTSESSLMEVGCGDGRLAAAFKERIRWVAALEADESMAMEAIRRRVLCVNRTLDDYIAAVSPIEHDEEEPGFDAVVSCHVLEHFRDPLGALAHMRAILAKGGKCWAEVPNTDRPYNGLSHYFQWPHLFNFTAETLSLLFIRAGFEDVHVHEHGHMLFIYGTNGGRAPVSYDEAVGIFRQRGHDVPTGAEVAARLAAYEERWRSRQRTERAVRVLQAFRGGDDSVSLAELRDALDLLGEQSARAARMAQRAMLDGAAIVELCDAAIAGAERYSADPYVLGMYAGEASMAARLSHAVGNSLNAMKLIEVGA
jgi:SAM-dependent methyltransferase